MAAPSGIYRCDVPDSSGEIQSLFAGLFLNTEGTYVYDCLNLHIVITTKAICICVNDLSAWHVSEQSLLLDIIKANHRDHNF